MKGIFFNLYFYAVLGGILIFSISAFMQRGHASSNNLYVCINCPMCNVNVQTVSSEPGKCMCGKKLKETRIIKIEGHEAYLCQCEKENTHNDKDRVASHSDCPKDLLVKIDLEDKHLYYSNCDGHCPNISMDPGACKCGKKFVRI